MRIDGEIFNKEVGINSGIVGFVRDGKGNVGDTD